MQKLSPCQGVCELDLRDQCTGCLRFLSEIAAWPGLTAAQQLTLMDELDRRRLQQTAQSRVITS
ncbi:MAG: DUF1289 domain-containing protein [Gammaproteobacteria bacterium]|nr:DUF1289 domain-containing protein [Gammaproteobacteria bacterium]